MGKSSVGLDENIAGILCYVLGWISGIVFIVLERDSSFVKFHAIQSIIVFGFLSVVSAVLGWIPVIGTLINVAASVLAFVLWIVLMVKAGRGERYKVKWAGDYAEKWAGGNE